MSKNDTAWQFFIDRGGTFTDLVAVAEDGSVSVLKLLSEDPEHYADACLEGIRRVLGDSSIDTISRGAIDQVRMGTTVATNALLERKGEPTLLITNRGFKDALAIGYQNRPDIFARHIQPYRPLYSDVVEVPGRLSAQGKELEPFDAGAALALLRPLAEGKGFRSCAVAFMHSYFYPEHELACAEVARQAGFTSVTLSSQVSPLIKLVYRADTAVADAYLSPILERYVEQFSRPLGETPIYFMQSNGGLVDRSHFSGKDSLLSGPAGGVVGAVESARANGFERVIGFDMGGTSTDVFHYDREFETSQENVVAGTRIRTPMLAIHTIAAGGGSIVRFDGHRFRVGPDSAGANPGPACYRKNGPLTVTDCNLELGRIQARYFPKVFGKSAREPIDEDIVHRRFLDLKEELREIREFASSAEIAWGFIEIAVEAMAAAIKKITIERGHDLRDYVLCSFGGAGGQHAILVAEKLGIKRVLLSPLAGVLSALGIGLSHVKAVLTRPVQKSLADCGSGSEIENSYLEMEREASHSLEEQTATRQRVTVLRQIDLRYRGSDTTLTLAFDGSPDELADKLASEFHALHLRRYGFHSPAKEIIVESLRLSASAAPRGSARSLQTGSLQEKSPGSNERQEPSLDGNELKVPLYSRGTWQDARLIERRNLKPSDRIDGPAIILDDTGTNVIESGWTASLTGDLSLLVEKSRRAADSPEQKESPGGDRLLQQSDIADPIMLELFNNKFMAIAEEMGVTLKQTSHSVNIKERLDFSCALFDNLGRLISNAPHMPVHLGSMGESVRSVIDSFDGSMRPGDVYVLNNPYRGGTHLPDITVITPAFFGDDRPSFFTASRGHHADVGGITPGSMPPGSVSIDEEGALIDPMLLVRDGSFREAEIRTVLLSGKYPARNIEQNIADLKAQVAANSRGLNGLERLLSEYGLETIFAYMNHVRQNAEDCVREAISHLKDGSFEVELDNGGKIAVTIDVDRQTRSAIIDFAGTSPQLKNNFNAPSSITRAAVLYVFRTLVEDNIPLNDGCLEPITLKIPAGSMLNPDYPGAVVAGNVETSQAIVDALYGALGVMAASQGTMNNFTLGNDEYQYYETICGGSGAGPDHHGTDAIHTHMTNSRLTDPEVLEWRYPLILREFSIRRGSGGAGRYRGGDGAVRRIEFAQKMKASILSGRRIKAPFGLAGGEDALPGRNYVIRHCGRVDELSGTDSTEVEPGDVFVIETPGGGAWGKAD
ncbi:MAG: hydantoinase B/oxoprolinase family protein [Candidatus Melainabacteria bacterium]|nr:hydantoinase B/oxoprolinase family protein [Candidatus Melainabacteria bacterium]